jgi:hypothetical protein
MNQAESYHLRCKARKLWRLGYSQEAIAAETNCESWQVERWVRGAVFGANTKQKPLASNVPKGLRNRKPPKKSSIFQWLGVVGNDESYEPKNLDGFVASDAPPGSPEKVELLKQRVERGQPLWHHDDRIDYAGMNGSMQVVAALESNHSKVMRQRKS